MTFDTVTGDDFICLAPSRFTPKRKIDMLSTIYFHMGCFKLKWTRWRVHLFGTQYFSKLDYVAGHPSHLPLRFLLI